MAKRVSLTSALLYVLLMPPAFSCLMPTAYPCNDPHVQHASFLDVFDLSIGLDSETPFCFDLPLLAAFCYHLNGVTA